MALIKLENVSKFYKSENNVSQGMRRVNLAFNLGEFVAITGESGSGKSTLLNVISGLDGYQEGEMYFMGEETSHYTISNWELYRGTYIGFIFQNYNIIDSYTVLQNVLLALEIQNYDSQKKHERALELIEKVGLLHRKNHKASKLSGGEKQRCVIARALAKDCPIIVADEPTGNLDSESSASVMKLLSDISQDKLVIVVTHSYEEISSYATRKIKMHDGEVIEDRSIKEYQEAQMSELKTPVNMSFFKILLFAVRNIFSTPKRLVFSLLMLIFAMFVFTVVYGGMKTMVNANVIDSATIYNALTERRMLVSKRDSSSLNDDDYNYWKTLTNSNYIVRKAERVINNSGQYKTDFIAILDPKNINGEKDQYETYDVIVHQSVSSLIGSKLLFYYPYQEEFTIVGITSEGENNTVYLSDQYVTNKITSSDELSVEDLALSKINGFSLFHPYDIDSSLPKGTIGIPEGSYPVVEGTDALVTFECQSVSMKYTLNKEFSVVNSEDVILISALDLEEIMAHFQSQIEETQKIERCFSISIAGKEEANSIFKRYDSSKYIIYYPANLSVPIEELLTYFLVILAFIIIVIVGIIIFALVRIVTSNVMKSRKKDFAIYRSIGATQRSLSWLVVIEQGVMALMAIVITTTLVIVLNSTTEAFGDMFAFMEPFDYIVIMLLILLLAIRMGFSFNKRIFKYSVVETLALGEEGTDL